jgi:hypothetical protein
MVLQLLLRFFTHTDETEQQLDILAHSAIGTMGRVLRPTLTTLPIGPEHPDRTAGFSFEMFYSMGNLVPAGTGLGAAARARIHPRRPLRRTR